MPAVARSKPMEKPPCEYPIATPFASSARPKLCGKEGGVAALVPYLDELGRTQYKIQSLCLKHCVETAVWKYAQNLPKRPYSDGEIQFLLEAGYTIDELAPPEESAPMELEEEIDIALPGGVTRC